MIKFTKILVMSILLFSFAECRALDDMDQLDAELAALVLQPPTFLPISAERDREEARYSTPVADTLERQEIIDDCLKTVRDFYLNPENQEKTSSTKSRHKILRTRQGVQSPRHLPYVIDGRKNTRKPTEESSLKHELDMIAASETLQLPIIQNLL